MTRRTGARMKRVLLTGGTGFIGRNIRHPLSGVCELYAPSRQELNLLDERAVRAYLRQRRIEIIIHAANADPGRSGIDRRETVFEDNMRGFMNLFHAQEYYERMYMLGSGAEYDKSRDMVLISEEEAGRSIPRDAYGLAKYLMSQLTEGSGKHCNLRIFGCYGPTDYESKFITHAIRCCSDREPITIRQDCYFDYMYVGDLTGILEYFIYHTPVHKVYNVCTGTRHLLSEIADMVRRQMDSRSEIVFLKEGLNREYTGSNRRLSEELGGYSFTSLEEGIRLQIAGGPQLPARQAGAS